MSEDSLHDALCALIGQASETSRSAADPVCRAQIRRWLEAMGDDNPVYLKENRAPRAMLPVFTNRGLRETVAANDDICALTSAITGFGLFPAGVGIVHNYAADIHVGEMVHETTQVESVSPRKVTRLGAGYFITVRTSYANQDGTDLGAQRITVLAYPSSRKDARPSEAVQIHGAMPPPPIPKAEALPPLSVTMDRLAIIAACAACGDFTAGHYDPAIAHARGFEDIFTDVYTGIGLVHRFATHWAGPGACVGEVNLKLGASFYAGDTLHLSGEVREHDGAGAMLAVRGLCRTGTHMDGFVKLVTG